MATRPFVASWILLLGLALSVRGDKEYSTCGGVYSSRSGDVSFSSRRPKDGMVCHWTFQVPSWHRLVFQLRSNAQYSCQGQYLRSYIEERSVYVINGSYYHCHDTVLSSNRNVRLELHSSYLPFYSASGSYRIEPLSFSEAEEIVHDGDSTLARSCLNGGVGKMAPNLQYKCICLPGFGGQNCDKACGWDRYGNECEKTCSNTPAGCKGRRFRIGDDWLCASGLKGPNCDHVCESGYYGSNCTLPCGNCEGGKPCDPTTGHCQADCSTGFLSPFCVEELTHLEVAPAIAAINGSTLNGSFSLKSEDRRGRGLVVHYRVEYKLVGTRDWVFGGLGRLEANSSNLSQNFTIISLPLDSEIDLRVLLLDQNTRAFEQVPFVRVRTTGRRRVENLKATNVAPRSVQLAWDSYDFKQGDYFYLRQQCLSLLACSKPCPQPEVTQFVATPSASVQGLLPAASYRFTVVATGNHKQSIVVNTPTLPPDTSVSSLRVTARTNSSAFVEWESPTECDQVFGPTAGYDWRLTPVGKGDVQEVASVETTATGTLLTGLEPLHDYKFSVSLRNPDGVCPANRVATIDLTTHHTVPDPPRDLAVYRLNRTSLWLRWRPPARPSGALRSYVIKVASHGSGKASGPSAKVLRTESIIAGKGLCKAWPDHVCHIVSHLKPRTRYVVSVSAVNEHGDQPGEEASVDANTEKGVSEPPQDLQVVSVDCNKVRVAWSLPSHLNTDLTYFEVAVARHVRPDEESAETDVEDPDPQRYPVSEEKPRYEYDVEGLQPGATYSIAVSCGYVGRPSELQVTAKCPDRGPDSGENSANSDEKSLVSKGETPGLNE